jgi:hypothetical protein
MLLFCRKAPLAQKPEWTPENAEILARFLQGPTGARLRAALIAEIAAANERAAMKAAPFDCGWACGYRGLYAWFEALSAPALAAKEPQTETDPFGEAPELEHLHP